MTSDESIRPSKNAERLAVMVLTTIASNLVTATGDISERLSLEDKAMLQYIQERIDIICRHVYAAFDPASREYIVRNAKDYEFIIRRRKITDDSHWMYVNAEDLETIVQRVRKEECEVCLLNVAQARQCKLRKALRNLIDEPDEPVSFGCGYRHGDAG